MRRWLTEEVSLDELLGDEIMDHVTRTAGLDRSALRRSLVDLARRLGERPGPEPSRCCEACLG